MRIRSFAATLALLACIAMPSYATTYDISFDADVGPDGSGLLVLDAGQNITQFDWDFDVAGRGGFDTSFDYFSDGSADFLRDVVLGNTVGIIGFFSTTPFLFGDLIPTFTSASFSRQYYRFVDFSGVIVSDGDLILTERVVPLPGALWLLLMALPVLTVRRR